MMPVNLFLVRHGESLGNVAKRLSENGDHSLINRLKGTHTAHWPLTKKGMEQAKKTGDYLRLFCKMKDIYFDRMYVSSYARARQTAAMLDVIRSSWIIDTRITERDWGELDRMTEEERTLKCREVIDMQKVEPFFWTPPNGESFNDLIIRIRDFIDSLHRSEAQNILVVCHGEVMKAFRIIFQGLTPEEYAEMEFSTDPIKRIHNCQIDHYTRRDPDLKSAELTTRFEWLHVYRPVSGGTDFAWIKLPRRRFTSHELLEQANKLSDSLSDIDI